jgi:hypothetical protein
MRRSATLLRHIIASVGATLMKRGIVRTFIGLMILLTDGGQSFGQVVINELVKEERTATSGAVTPDTREFIELYNAGSAPVDLSGWSIVRWDYATDGPGLPPITLPTGSTIAQNDYFVIGGSAIPAAVRDFMPDTGQDLFPDVAAYALELRNSSNAMVDAVAYDLFQSGIFPPTAEQATQIGDGFQGQLMSTNVNAPNTRQSWSRYRDGRDTNSNGRDFGVLPLTPGATNNLPLNDMHTVPDVDGLANGTRVNNYYASFIQPTVIDPMVVDSNNLRSIPRSPQGGKAMVAWDPPGGNAAYSKELVNGFNLYAYFDTTPIGLASTTNDEEWESHIYGIGSTDAFFANPDPTGGIFVPGTITQNASTGIGWLYQQYEEQHPDVEQPAYTKLMLVDFGDGGNSLPEAMEWEVIEEIDMSAEPSGWYRLGLDYDPAAGQVVATFDDQTFTFTTDMNRFGTFFVGYREALTGNPLELHNPPIFDLFSAPPAGLTGDFNGDGAVDAADYVQWRDGGTLQNEGGITPGMATPDDYQTWRSNFGKTATGAASFGAAVPEPRVAALMAIGMLAMAWMRRGR